MLPARGARRWCGSEERTDRLERCVTRPAGTVAPHVLGKVLVADVDAAIDHRDHHTLAAALRGAGPDSLLIFPDLLPTDRFQPPQIAVGLRPTPRLPPTVAVRIGKAVIGKTGELVDRVGLGEVDVRIGGESGATSPLPSPGGESGQE